MAQYPSALQPSSSHFCGIRNLKDLPSSRRFLSRIPRSKVDPGRPSGTSPWRFLCVGFWVVNTIAICIKPANGAVSSFGKCGLPCGLRDFLCTLQWFCSVPVNLLHHCNTRYRWVVNPSLAGTLTLRKAPSFAWRTNDFRLSCPASHRGELQSKLEASAECHAAPRSYDLASSRLLSAARWLQRRVGRHRDETWSDAIVQGPHRMGSQQHTCFLD